MTTTKQKNILKVMGLSTYPIFWVAFIALSAFNLISHQSEIFSSWTQWRICILFSIFANIIFLFIIHLKIELEDISIAFGIVILGILITALGGWLVYMFVMYTTFFPTPISIEPIVAAIVFFQSVSAIIIIKGV
ncbi:hypothetical protein ACN09C_26605 (plasmid) [Serratia fonticola]|uniref:hypothetical protein n=1 Tax=Serratia fonticola TaxID=47917 RepID=UPI003AFFB2CA